MILIGTGKLTIQVRCKGYSVTALLSTKSDIQANTSKYGGDLLSKVESPFECCENLGIPLNLSHIELDMKFKHVISHMEDLKYASFKISELEKIAREQEWKHKHTQYHKTYSVLGYIAITLIALYGVYRLGRFLLQRWQTNKILRAITSAKNGLDLATETRGAGNVVNINIKTINESLAMNPEAIPLQDLDISSTKDSNPELRRSKCLRTPKSYF
jgi:hypothetical protein